MQVIFPTRWPWPLPALAAWLAAWAAFAALRLAGAPALLAFGAALGAGAVLAMAAQGRWRRALAAGGFPLSALALGGLPALPAWAWGLALLPLLLAYPLRAWRDAPFFPTPAQALDGLERVAVLPAGARVLDAGCGLGHGLAALHRTFPTADLHGTEWSRPLAWGAAWRCRFARVRRGDMWAQGWSGFHLVYLFQRPESMARAWEKACRELPGGWLASLEFAVPGVEPVARLGARPLWVYRIPGSTEADPRR
jgi:hypothetical protein